MEMKYRNLQRLLLVACLAASTLATNFDPARADEKSSKQLAADLGKIETEVFSDSQRQRFGEMVPNDIRRRRQAVNDRSRKSWYKISNRQQWESFRDPRRQSLRRSLGNFPPPPEKIVTHVTGSIQGEGFVIENLVFESLPGLWVTANLYKPAKPGPSMPGILICHSHHTPKEHGELQDMGMTWARAGCLVLVMDQIGHGERRQHPFRSADDYKDDFRVSRQDYYFRYDNGIHLHLAGRSLIGQMAWDLSRGVDVLLAQRGADPKRIALLGSVAGGGDPAAVTAALDERITLAVPFNFGGPQPETRFPLPKDSETTFNYAGSGSWESTRNLQKSTGGGFLPWVIVGSVPPRRLVFAHEFNWDRPSDPVWKRLQTIYGFYDSAENLDYTHGFGELKLRPPNASHCTHIGPAHRKRIHAALARWFKIPVAPENEYSNRRDKKELTCMTVQWKEKLQPLLVRDILAAQVDRQLAKLRVRHAKLSPNDRRKELQRRYAEVLGDVTPTAESPVAKNLRREKIDGAIIERFSIKVEPEIDVPVLLLMPKSARGKVPVVVAIAQSGKKKLLAARREEFAELLAGGCAVCLLDVRGTGETSFGEGRSRRSYATSLSSSELMLGGTMVGARLRDLRAVLKYLRSRGDLDAKKIALWGDSLAKANGPKTNFNMPRGIDGLPRQSEPLGGLLVLLAALYEDDVAAVYVRGGLAGFRSTLVDFAVTIPHDVVMPGILLAGDLCDIAAALAPKPLRLEALVDGRNVKPSRYSAQTIYEPALKSYRRVKASPRFVIDDSLQSPAKWLLQLVRSQ